MLILTYTVRKLSNGACGLLIFPADQSMEAARELTAAADVFPAAVWSVSLLLPGGVRLSLPAAALPEVVERVRQEGAGALLRIKERPRRLPVCVEEPDNEVRRLIRRLGGDPVSEGGTVLLRWDEAPEQVPELLRDRGVGAVLAVDPRGRLESTALLRPRPLNWAEESQLRLRFAMREAEDTDGATRFLLPPGRIAFVDGDRLPAGEYTLYPGGISRMLPAAARAAAVGAETCMDMRWPALPELWDLYTLWFGTGISQPPETESSPLWGALQGLLPKGWERRLPPMKTLTGADAEYLTEHLLISRVPSDSPERPLGKRGARELIRCLCGADPANPRRPAEITALLRLGAERIYFSEAPRVLYWDREQIENMVSRLGGAL